MPKWHAKCNDIGEDYRQARAAMGALFGPLPEGTPEQNTPEQKGDR